MNVYVVLFHDVWDLGRDPGVENEYGEPETTTIEAIYGSLTDAQAFIAGEQALFPDLDPTRAFHTIEQKALE